VVGLPIILSTGMQPKLHYLLVYLRKFLQHLQVQYM
jgi:hypothetical protein